MFSKIKYISINSFNETILTVEVDIANTMPALNIVEFANITVQESKKRVRTTIKNSEYCFSPTGIMVNLAPAYIREKMIEFLSF